MPVIYHNRIYLSLNLIFEIWGWVGGQGPDGWETLGDYMETVAVQGTLGSLYKKSELAKYF